MYTNCVDIQEKMLEKPQNRVNKAGVGQISNFVEVDSKLSLFEIDNFSLEATFLCSCFLEIYYLL